MTPSDIDIDELIARLLDAFSAAMGLCRNGKRTDEEIFELLQTVEDFNYTAPIIDRGATIPRPATPAAGRMPIGPGVHHETQVRIESTRPEHGRRHAIDELTQAIDTRLDADLPGLRHRRNVSTQPPDAADDTNQERVRPRRPSKSPRR